MRKKDGQRTRGPCPSAQGSWAAPVTMGVWASIREGTGKVCVCALLIKGKLGCPG